jgi:O-antigen ligase
MLGVIVIVFLCLKPIETKRLWPLVVPAVVVVHFAMPGTIGGFKAAFFPEGGIIAQQSRLGPGQDPLLAGGRVRQLRPMLAEASERPLFGEGFGTRVTGFNTPERNAPILDNQWLNNVLEIGFVGLAAWVWLFVGAGRLLIRASRASGSGGDSWLFAALAASIISFPVGMLTYDAFGYTQVTFIFWIVLGISTALLRISGDWPRWRVPAVSRRRVLRV